MPRRGSAVVILAVLGVAAACKRAPTDDSVVAAVLARHVVDPKLDAARLDSEVRMYVVERRQLDPVVSALTSHARVRCGTGPGELECDVIRDRAGPTGGYSSCEERTFVHDGALAAMRVDCSATEDWPRVAPFDLDAFGAGQPSSNGLVFTFRDDALLAKAREDRVGDLGPLAPVAVPPELADAYDTLTSPLLGLALGDGCGDPGGPGLGNAETEALVRAGRFDLLRSVARSLNKEGRVLAALALLEHAKPLLAEDVAVIQKIRATTKQVRKCQACGVDFKDAADILPEPTAPAL